MVVQRDHIYQVIGQEVEKEDDPGYYLKGMERPIEASVVHIWAAFDNNYWCLFHFGCVIVLFLDLV